MCEAIFHHQFDVHSGSSLWVTVKGNADLMTAINRITPHSPVHDLSTISNRFAFSLMVHQVLCDWSLRGW
jgi:hypothetical protein